MKLFSANAKTDSARARNAALLNLLATPGLGSLMAGRWLAGTGQLLLSILGFALILVWFWKIIVPYYQLMFSDTPAPVVHWKTAGLGVVFFATAWIWSLFTSISLHREASRAKVETLKNFVQGSKVKLSEAQIQNALAQLPDWQRNGDEISRTFEFADFLAAMKFVNAVAQIAEAAQHHPDMDVRWNKVKLVFTTHDAGGLTEKDFALAKKTDELSLL